MDCWYLQELIRHKGIGEHMVCIYPNTEIQTDKLGENGQRGNKQDIISYSFTTLISCPKPETIGLTHSITGEK